MHWIAFGDIHESTDRLAAIPDLADAEAVIITGDLTNCGNRRTAQSVIDAVAAINPTIFAQPGNMDTDAVQTVLRQQDMDLHLRVRELAPNLAIMGVGMSSPTPFGTPSEVPEATLVEWLHQTHADATDFAHLIVAIHEPPHNTLVDRIDNDLHVGSEGVRQFIEQTQPVLVLTGHIHESKAVDHIGTTPVINPGMLADGGYVRIDFDGENITAQLLSVS
ncbi:serine/threonine protein phosphatase [Pseudodesulfovibrio sp. JC047]|uniref:metallophosphoesterase family protein n=1 Tax=Pseudodesulfovibrio sp. JC047 TaxID=2683199 RepID=UPI0013D673D2|nr:metallophosphoesterase [Pseudodesulfovibrio sp. JC047]NDV18823.1 serine/threonine protein phosphatase [Pseudodesulfovibrio sp. JC047]